MKGGPASVLTLHICLKPKASTTSSRKPSLTNLPPQRLSPAQHQCPFGTSLHFLWVAGALCASCVSYKALSLHVLVDLWVLKMPGSC